MKESEPFFYIFCECLLIQDIKNDLKGFQRARAKAYCFVVSSG